ncbi:zinc finger BED domain-containing protein 5-like [Palaemon carinicauda]|uniref:zinc finger BED domain-containing protein 5-like n=1 Tax=Palaemon carinicauda TaxID=392227 RepID=UPI0035B697F8
MKIISRFWELCQVFKPEDFDTANEGATGEKLFNSIISTFKTHNIPMKNVVGFGSEGCNVMMGCNNSVSSRLRLECPGIVVMKCICHSAHLCASEACKTLPRRCEDLARNIYNFMKCSSKRQAQLLQLQAFLDLKPHKMLHPSQTRWLSMAAVVSRILQQWEALKLFFIDMCASEKIVSAQEILEYLCDPILKFFFFFLQWVLPKFNSFNAYLQSSRVIVIELHDKICELYREILLCFMERQYVMQTDLEDIDPQGKKNI